MLAEHSNEQPIILGKISHVCGSYDSSPERVLDSFYNTNESEPRYFSRQRKTNQPRQSDDGCVCGDCHPLGHFTELLPRLKIPLLPIPFSRHTYALVALYFP